MRRRPQDARARRLRGEALRRIDLRDALAERAEILQPPTYVPAAMARAAETITQSGGRVKSGERLPDATSASAMIPMVLCASFVPCGNATNPPETSWARRKTWLTRDGERLAMSQVIARIRANATTTPTNGAMRDGINIFSFSPPHWTTSQPDAITAEPSMPPINAWLEHVLRVEEGVDLARERVPLGPPPSSPAPG
jgi:hypothetical protein